MTDTANDLRQKAKKLFRKLPELRKADIDELIDAIIDAAVAEIRDGHMVDVPNTGYYGVIVKKDK